MNIEADKIIWDDASNTETAAAPPRIEPNKPAPEPSAPGIAPEAIVWDDAPATTLSPEQAKVRSEQQARKWSWRMRTFTGDKPDYFACIEDPGRRKHLEEITGNNEDFKKQIAVALHLADYDPGKLDKIDFMALDQYAEAAFGQGMTGAKAYDKLRELFTMERSGEIKRDDKGDLVRQSSISFKADPDRWKITGVAEKFYDEALRGYSGLNALFFRMLADDVTNPGDVMQPIRRAITPDAVRNFFRDHAARWEEASKNFGIASQYDLTAGGAPGGKSFFSGFTDDNGDFTFGGGMSNFGWNMLYEAPHLAIQIGLTTVNPILGAAYMGARSAGSEYADMRGNGYDPNSSALSAFGVGLVDTYLSYFIDTKIIRGMGDKLTAWGFPKLGKIVAGEEEAKRGFRELGKYILKNAPKEGLEEVEEQIAGNLWRMAVTGDGFHTFGEFFDTLVDGVPDSFIMGAAMGVPMSAVGGVQNWRLAAARDTMIRRIGDWKMLQAYRQGLLELQAKQPLTPLQTNDLDRIERMSELGDVDKLRDILFTEALIAANVSKITAGNPSSGNLTTAAIGARARAEWGTDRKLVHNPDDSRKTLDELRAKMAIPEWRIVAVESIADLPEAVRKRVKGALDDTGNGNFYGFYDSDTDTAYINVAKTSPHMVAPILWHEYLTHRGLRTVLGEAGMNRLLDQVWQDYADYIKYFGIDKRYNADPTTAKGQRLAAEEFLARHAEEMSYRLTWAWDNEETGKFRKLLGKMRQLLAPVLPQAYLTYTSDARMARMLARALRPLDYDIKRGKTERGAGDVRFATGNGGIRKNAGRTSTSSFTNSGNTEGSPLDAYEDTKHAVTQRFERLADNIPPDKNKVKGVLKGLQAIAEEIVTKHRVTPKNFITTAEYAGFTRSHGGGSSYLHIGDNAEIRLSDHSADADTFKKTGPDSNNISVVVRRHGKKTFNPDDNVNLLELHFNGDRLSERQLLHIVQDVAGFVATGEYHDTAGAPHYEFSGTKKFVAEAIDRLYQDALDRNDTDAQQRLIEEACRRGLTDTKVVKIHGKPLSVGADGKLPAVKANAKPLMVYHDTNAKIYINKETGENWDEIDWEKREEWENRDDWEEHWQEQDFYTFSRVRARRSIEYPGFFFRPTPDPNHEYGKRRIAAYLNITNPAINPTIENAGVYDDSGEVAMKKLIEQGYDGVIRTDENGNVEEYIAFFPEQIKLADPVTYDDDGNVIPPSQRFNRKKDDIRFAVAPEGESGNYVEPTPFIGADLFESFSENEIRIMRDMLLETAENNRLEVYDKAQSILAESGCNVTAAQARTLAALAVDEVKARQRRIRKRGDDDYITSVDQYVAVLSGHYDINFKINFNQEFGREEKSGTWVETRKKTREGIPADEAARVLTNEWGREVTTSELYEHFNGLNRRDILGKRTEENRAQLEAMLAAEYENDMLLWEEIRQGRMQLTPELLDEHPNIARLLRKKIAKSAFMTKEELAREFYKHINTESVPGFAEDPEFVASLLSEAEADLARLKEELKKDKADALALQREAARFARQHVPEEARGEFTSAILKLAELKSTPTPDDPQGPRMRAFEDLLDKMRRRAEKLRVKQNREALDKRLSEVYSKVNQARRFVGTRDLATQALLDDIVEISRLTPGEIDRRTEELQTQIEAALNDSRDPAAPEEDLFILSTFGDLDAKSADDLAHALKLLNGIAADGRQKLLAEIEQRRAADQSVRDWIIRRVTDGRGVATDQAEFDANWKALEKAWGKTREGLFSLLKLEDFLYLMATNRQTGDWIESPVGKIFQKVHSSAVAQDTYLREFADVRNRMLRECLGARNDTAAVMKLAAARKRVEHTGIFRHSATLRDIRYVEVPLAEARKLLAEYDAGNAGLEDYQAEFLRDRLASLDLRMDRSYKRAAEDGVTEKMLKQMDTLDGKNDFKTISYPVVTFTDGDGYEMQNLNRMEALYLHLMWQQRDVRYKMKFNGYTDETMRQVEKFLTPELIRLGDEMRDFLSSVGIQLDAINRALYHAPLPLVEKYFPALFKVDRNGGGATRLSPDDPNAGRVPTQFLPGALKARNAHVREIKITDAFAVFEGHVRQTAHYIAWAETAREVRSVLLNAEVKKALSQVFGPEFTQQMQSAVVDALNGGNLDAANANKLIKGFNKLYGSAVSMKMLFSYMSGIKQMMSAVSYLNDVPPAAFMRGVARALEHPIETFGILDKSPYLRNRLSAGPDMWTNMVLDRSNRNATLAGLWGGKLMDWGSVFTRYGDMVPVVLAGASVYYYHYDKMIAEGFAPAEARKHALLRWEMSTESLQQSRAVHNQNAIQRSNAKFLTAFKSSQILNAQRPLREAIAYHFFGEQHAGLKRDAKAYDDYLAKVAVTKKLTLTPAEKKILRKFYKDFPLGKTITNRWGEALTFAPLDEFAIEDYIHHFAVKRGTDANGAKTERFSGSYLELFKELQETLKNPDERILTVTAAGEPRINYLKKITAKNGNHYVIAAVSQDGRIVPWTHMDSTDKYIEKQRAAEKAAVEKYGLVDGNGNRVYMTYDEYLKRKKDAPLYLATAAAHQSMTPQTAISDRVPNIARPGNLSREYSGAPPSGSRKALISGTLLTMVVVSALINAAGALDRRSRGKDRDKDPEDTLGDILANSALDPLQIFPTVGSVAPAVLALLTDRRVLNSDRLYFGDDIINAVKGGKSLWEAFEDGDFEFDEEAFDAATDILRGLGLWLPIPRAVGSLAYRAKRLYDVYDNLTE